MANSCVRVYVHCVWATWDRKPLVTSDLEAQIHACIAAECRATRSFLLEVGGTENHVHVLTAMHPSVSISEVVRRMKGGSSHLTTHQLDHQQFKWQGSYGAFSVSQEHLDRVRNYIRRQKEHHASGEVYPEWERCFDPADGPDSPRRRAS